MTGPYPLGLRLAGRPVLVVGGGAVAQRRIPALLAAGAVVMLVAPAATPALDERATLGEITWQQRKFEPSDVDGQWLVLAATDDPAVNATVSAAAESVRVFCVRADDAAAATAWTPTVTGADDLTVAVWGGGDPRRSVRLREAIAAGLADGSLDAPRFRAPETAPAGRLVPAAPRPVPGVALVGAGPGDPELITVRGRRLLSRADVVVVDRLAPQLLLDGLRSDVEVIDAAKIPHGRQLAQESINAVLVERALAGRFVVRLKGGDPFVFGRGGEEAAACLAAGVPVTVVPGVSSAIAVPGLAGIPVTHRGITHELVVCSGHVPPDHPDSLVDWPALARLRGTVVLLMAVGNLAAIADRLIQLGRAADTLAAVVERGGTPEQRTVRGTLSTIAAAAERERVGAPAVVVIGAVVAAIAAG
ncbi:uroporphyrinogen-III C-methyltransferase [Actinocatenispora thailandica]|uniref:Uroporphyrinogen-III C-methyltransferase n=1 Tax=Actinocatenispora thailandica TaxID=227318 RepID=A0A7R7DN49_9ACTN|nr:uroporphyrinogen-III C-methyltransferase [Actinocatenispora thailandica]BCJ34427.1 uroporphyrinogen-III C-methyltransferase [Actinocatenispora thailandica]